jgi:hypothetical protein
MKIKDAIKELESSPKNVKFKRLLTIVENFFELASINGSHHRYKTPWQGNPRINLQKDGAKAKLYQVKQVTQALKKLEGCGD